MAVDPAPDVLGAWRAEIERALRAAVHDHVDGTRRAPAHLRSAMEYSLLAGGKRLRPLLVLAAAGAVQRTETVVAAAVPAAVGVELVHTYSLIHDDLPALDNDDLRRGRPSLHKAFDEATAILAGDALLTDAFAHVASSAVNAARQVRELALAAGSAGMVGGQIDDVENAGAADLATLADVHARKTGRLIMAACGMGALAGGADDATVERLRDFGRSFGLAFQITDDVLDVTGGDRGGKGSGRDARRNKVTWATALGVDAARARARAELQIAVDVADTLRSAPLAALARFAADRDH